MSKTGVFLMRGQPVHNAHVATIRQMLAECDNVIVILGSCTEPRSPKNPFTFAERANMIHASCEAFEKVLVLPSVDFIYDDARWAASIVASVSGIENNPKNVYLYGHTKDESSFYLKMFPQWNRVEVPLLEPLNATTIREMLFAPTFNPNWLIGVCPPAVVNFMVDFHKTEAFEKLLDEVQFIEDYKKPYAGLPYPPIFVTADAVVTMKGHVLLVKRKAFPGTGLWALPGGFVNAKTDKSVQDAALRELKEETKIKVPEAVLRGSIKREKVFDHPNRSARGRTITHAFLIELTDETFPKVKGSDDAEEAVWVPFHKILRTKMFEDHWHIIDNLVGLPS